MMDKLKLVLFYLIWIPLLPFMLILAFILAFLDEEIFPEGPYNE